MLKEILKMPVILNDDLKVPRLIILRGSPAVGKSTVASKVASLNSAKKKAHIGIDNFQLYDRRSMSVDREKLAIRNAALLTKNFLREEFDVVVDYVFDDTEDQNQFINFIFGSELIKLDTIYVQQFYLDAPLEKIIKRNQSRSGKRGEYMNLPLLRKLYEKTSKTKGTIEHEFIIDTTRYNATQCAGYILSYPQAYKNDEILEIISLSEKDLARAPELKDD